MENGYLKLSLKCFFKVFYLYIFIVLFNSCGDSNSQTQISFTSVKPVSVFPRWKILSDTNFFEDVAVNTNGTNGWAVGRGVILHYTKGDRNNGLWQDETPAGIKTAGLYLNSVALLADGSAWALGNGVILHYTKGDHNNGLWQDETPAAIKTAGSYLHSIAVQADGSAWVVGDGVILHKTKVHRKNKLCMN
jgi:hypothetical protein